MANTQTAYTIAEELHSVLGDAVNEFEFADLVDRVAAYRGVTI